MSLPSAERVWTCTRSVASCPTGRARRRSAPSVPGAGGPRSRSASAGSTAAPSGSSTAIGSGGSCLTPVVRGRTTMLPLTSGANAPTTSRTAEGKTLTPRTISMSSVRPMQRIRGPVRPHGHGLILTCDVVAGAEAQQRRGAVARWVRTSSPVAPSANSIACSVSGSISSGWTNPCAPRCMPSWCSHSPHSETPMSPIPIASVTRRAPGLLQSARGSRARRRRARPRRAPW